ncbi:MAG: hypothetical protein AAF563_11475 [Pseudomonadota bacterium]
MRVLKRLGLAAAFVAGLALAGMPSYETRAQEFMVLDGTHWQEMDEGQRIAFVSGVMHVLEFERQLKGDTMMAEERSFVPHMIAAVKGRTIGEVSVDVTDYYIGNPDDLGRPVISTIVRVYTVQPL